MPLSDRERELLEQMERALSAEDPKLASTFSISPSARVKKGAVIGVLLILLGIGALFAGLFTQLPIVGVIGFVIALAGTISVMPNLASVGAPKAKRSKPAVNSKMQDRWNRRNFE